MKEPQMSNQRPKYLIKHDILIYYYNTYIGLAVVFLLLVIIKMELFSWQPCLLLTGIVIARIIYEAIKIAPSIACPFCEAGHRKGKWASNVLYLATIPLEKEEFQCPTCGKHVEIIDKE